MKLSKRGKKRIGWICGIILGVGVIALIVCACCQILPGQKNNKSAPQPDPKSPPQPDPKSPPQPDPKSPPLPSSPINESTSWSNQVYGSSSNYSNLQQVLGKADGNGGKNPNNISNYLTGDYAKKYNIQMIQGGQNGSQIGYFTPNYEAGQSDDLVSMFSCVDWTFGSAGMKAQEELYQDRTGDKVKFGVGTDGCAQTNNMGGCYRITYANSDGEVQPTDLIVQSVNSGGDVACPQFDLMQGAGGQGAFNSCSGDTNSQYSNGPAMIGKEYGGYENSSECSKIDGLVPTMKVPYNINYPTDKDELGGLCSYAFEKEVRGENGLNSVINTMTPVICPVELTDLTGFRRSDPTFTTSDGVTINPVDPQKVTDFDASGTPYADAINNTTCGFNQGSLQGNGCLSRMMDCRKPSASNLDNNDLDKMEDGMKVLNGCTADGYTRIQAQQGCFYNYC